MIKNLNLIGHNLTLKQGLISFLLLMVASSQFTNPGCSNFSNTNECLGCHDRYYLNEGICLPVSPLCQNYSLADGSCLSCFADYELVVTRCQRILPANCLNYTVNRDCYQCEDRFFIQEGTCHQMSPQCDKYLSNGTCLQCFPSYILEGSECLPKVKDCLSQVGSVCQQCLPSFILRRNHCQRQIDGCISYNQQQCTQCQESMELVDSTCFQVIEGCQNYNSSTGQCATCHPFFKTLEGYCVPELDPFCSLYNGTICLECSKGSYFNQDQRCQNVDPLCKTHDLLGQCLSCFNGYTLEAGNCLEAVTKMDPNCFWFDGVECLQCSWGFRFNSQGACVALDYLCKIYEPVTYDCSRCYGGFMVGEQGNCQPISQAGCLTWFNNNCQSCSSDYYLSGGHCQKIDPQCAHFSLATFQCQACYPGYSLSAGKCDLLSADSWISNCRGLDSQGNCLGCYWGSYLKEGRCLTADSLCRTFDQTNGHCTSCYGGYFLIRKTGRCVPLH